MADEVTKKVVLQGEDQTGPAFKSAAQNAQLFGTQVISLSKALGALGIATSAYVVVQKTFDFLKEGISKFSAEADLINLTSNRLQSVGINAEEANPKIS